MFNNLQAVRCDFIHKITRFDLTASIKMMNKFRHIQHGRDSFDSPAEPKFGVRSQLKFNADSASSTKFNLSSEFKINLQFSWKQYNMWCVMWDNPWYRLNRRCYWYYCYCCCCYFCAMSCIPFPYEWMLSFLFRLNQNITHKQKLFDR